MNLHKKIDRPIAPECLHQRRKVEFDSGFTGVIIFSIKFDTDYDEESYYNPCAALELC